MAFRLPEQEDVSGTYLEALPYLRSLIEARLIPGKPESETARVWNDILHEVFPGRENFSTGEEMMMMENRRLDLFATHVVGEAKFEERKFLVVKCEGPGLETQPGIWKDGAKQLQRCLASIGQRHRKFGAIAVGKCVRFYALVGEDLQDMTPGEPLYLDRQCKTVMNHLVYIRENF